jgi:hypothetical protein
MPMGGPWMAGFNPAMTVGGYALEPQVTSGHDAGVGGRLTSPPPCGEGQGWGCKNGWG